MSYAFRQKRKALARIRREKEASLKSVARPAKKSNITNPSKIISMMAKKEKQQYWDYIQRESREVRWSCNQKGRDGRDCSLP